MRTTTRTERPMPPIYYLAPETPARMTMSGKPVNVATLAGGKPVAVVEDATGYRLGERIVKTDRGLWLVVPTGRGFLLAVK